MRTLTPAAAALLNSGHFGLAQLVELQLTSTVRLSTSGPNLTWGGNAWQGGALGIGSMSAIDQQGGEIPRFSFTLSAIPDGYLAMALSEPVRGKPVIVRTAIVDPADWTVADCQVEETGKLDPMSLAESALAEGVVVPSITVPAESAAIALIRARGLLYTDSHHQRLHPGDKGCEYVRDADLDIVWPDKTWGR